MYVFYDMNRLGCIGSVCSADISRSQQFFLFTTVFAWEWGMRDKVDTIRDEELDYIRGYIYIIFLL